MVTLRIAGLVIAALVGFGFTPVYMDYTPFGRKLRQGWASMRANPSLPVGLVLSLATVGPLGMLVAALVQGGSAGGLVAALVVVFVVFALVSVAATPRPKNLPAVAPPHSYLEAFAEEE